MPTQRVAFSCALATLILFSCNNKSKPLTQKNSGLVNYDTVNILADEAVNTSAYNTRFINDATQQFTAPVKKVSVITAKGGLKITVNPAALEKVDGSPVDGKINVSIVELTNSNDLFRSNAASISDGRLLASGGSYFIGMECNGQELRIKKGRDIKIDFPILSKNEMELFYGERNSDGLMNWKRAGINLVPKKERIFQSTDNRASSDFPVFSSSVGASFMFTNRPYRTLNEEVYYYNKKMTLREVIDTINRYTKRVYIDTIYAWPKELADLPKGTRVDTNHLNKIYGPRNQFFLRRYRDVEEEKARLARQQEMRDSIRANWRPQTLAGQLQKYYSPSSITSLGWINCDRYYPGERTDVEVTLPITFNDNKVEYFLLFKRMSGLLNLSADSTGSEKKVFSQLPVGEPVILIAFTKNNGQVFHSKEEFVIQKNKPVQLEFKNISNEEMVKMFGKNAKI